MVSIGGIGFSDELLTALNDGFNKVKGSKTPQLRAVFAHIVDKKEVAVSKQIQWEEEVSFADVVKEMAEAETEAGNAKPAYVFFYKSGATKEGLIMITWIPENARGGDKMLYSITAQALKSKASLKLYIEANDVGDVSEPEW